MYDEINADAVITSVGRGQERGVKNAIRGAGSGGKYDFECSVHVASDDLQRQSFD
jgi:tryptophan synthase beta subunit